MDKLKPALEILDLLLKVALAAAAFFLFGLDRDRLELAEKRMSVQEKQQTSNLVVAEKIISLLFEEKNKCIAEDQAFLIDFLIDNNNEYNHIKINKQDFLRASSARRHCAGGSIARDAQLSASLHEGSVPVLTSQDVPGVRTALENKGLTVEPVRGSDDKPSGYVAVGSFSAVDRSFRNFLVPPSAVGSDGAIAENAVIRPRWSVYLRANTSNTEEGSNAILGVVNENVCGRVLKSFTGVRGQTWAALKLVDCTRPS